MQDLSTIKNNLITEWAKPTIDQVNALKKSLGIKHHRNQDPIKSKIKFKRRAGEIHVISITMSKGDIMSHKGEGKYKESRTSKPFYTPVVEVRVPELADSLAESIGDVICGNLVRI